MRRHGPGWLFATTILIPGTAAARQAPAETVVFPCGIALHAGEAAGFAWLPGDENFCPLLADPKEPWSSAALLRGEFATLDDPDAEDATTIGSVGLGDRFLLARWGGARPGDGFMLGISGAIFAQFDLGSSSFDLINSDYLIGIPLTWRSGGSTARLRLYHQSSHLGDEYLLRDDEIRRENLSFESLELILSRELGPLRLYAGGEHLFRREPDTVDRLLAHGGTELHAQATGVLAFVAGLDVKLSEQQEWSPAWSGRIGIRFAPRARGGHPIRRVLLLAEYYSGPSPHGQFFQDDITYAGVGVHFMH